MKTTALRSKPITPDLSKKARLLSLAGDETRIRILCALFEKDHVCVSDIAKCLKMSVAAVSHHLQLMQENGLTSSVREGKKICYSLYENSLTKYLRQFICHKE